MTCTQRRDGFYCFALRQNEVEDVSHDGEQDDAEHEKKQLALFHYFVYLQYIENDEMQVWELRRQILNEEFKKMNDFGRYFWKYVKIKE